MINNILFTVFLSKSEIKLNPYLLPLGPVYCASSLHNSENNILGRILNSDDYYNDNTKFYINLSALIKNENINIICISGLSLDFVRIKKVCNFIKENHPTIKIILGGGLITADADFVMHNIRTDFSLIGEGEYTLPLLIKNINNMDIYHEIKGLCFRKKEEIIINPANDIEDINLIPFPNFSLFPEFEEVIQKCKVYPILLSRSCPYKCSFCFHTCGTRYRCRTLDNILCEINEAIIKYNITHLFFLDELFGDKNTPSLDLVKKIATLGLTYNAQTRADRITEETVKIYAETGCTNMSVGIESASNIILKSMRKGITIEEIEKSLLLLTENGVPTSGNIIIGDIEETMETAQRSINWYNKNKEKFNLSINMIQCYPGSLLFEYAIKHNIFNKDDFLNKAEFQKDFVVNLTKLDNSKFNELAKTVYRLKFFDEVNKDFLVKKDNL